MATNNISLSKDQRQQQTVDKLEEIRIKQIAGDIDYIEANISGEKIDANDAAYIHVRVNKRHKQPGDAEDMIETRVIKLHPEALKPSQDSGMFKAYSSFEIIHDPRKEVKVSASEAVPADNTESEVSEAPKPKKGKA